MQNYFSLFNLPQQFNLDVELLESNFRKIQSESHPDRFVSASPSERLASMQLATLANEAYDTLKNSAMRAKYLLEQLGIDAIADTNTSLPADFLMQQMEWREMLEDAKSNRKVTTLELLYSELRTEAKVMETKLVQLFDQHKDYIAATDVTRKLVFVDKVSADIQQAIEYIDD